MNIVLISVIIFLCLLGVFGFLLIRLWINILNEENINNDIKKSFIHELRTIKKAQKYDRTDI